MDKEQNREKRQNGSSATTGANADPVPPGTVVEEEQPVCRNVMFSKNVTIPKRSHFQRSSQNLGWSSTEGSLNNLLTWNCHSLDGVTLLEVATKAYDTRADVISVTETEVGKKCFS